MNYDNVLQSLDIVALDPTLGVNHDDICAAGALAIRQLRTERDVLKDELRRTCEHLGLDQLLAERDALRAERDKWNQAYQSMLDPIVRAKMLEPAPPMVAPIGMAEQVLLRERDKLRADLAVMGVQYNELIMAVAQKRPNESRHETALRYIRKAEQNSLGDTGSKQAGKDAT